MKSLILLTLCALPLMAQNPCPPGGCSGNTSRRGNTLCAIGDSLMGLNSTNTQYGPTLLNDFILSSQGQFTLINNGGISGQTTTQIAARIQTDVINQSCVVALVGGGTNDFTGLIPVTTSESNLLSMYNAVLNAGKTLIVQTIPPRTGSSGPQEIFNQTLNAWIRQEASLLGVPILDVYANVVDPATAGYKTGYSTDGIHPANIGLRVLGQAAVNGLGPFFPPHHPLLPYTNTDPNNLISNGLMLNGTPTPTGWSGTNTSGNMTYSVTTNTNILGNVAQGTKGASSGADSLSFTISSGLQPGHTYGFVGKFATSGIETGQMVWQILAFGFTAGFASTTGTWYPIFSYTGTDYTVGQWGFTFVMPTNTAIFQLEVSFGSGTGTIQVGQTGLYDLTALGLSSL